MFFSLIIPTKDRPALLRRALKSALAQNFTDFELLIVDDGDGTGAALANGLADSRIRAFSSQKRGQVAARNMALETARGVHIAWLDDDDWFEPFHLQQLAYELTRHAGIACASGWIAREDETGHIRSTLPFSAYANAQSLRENNTLILSGLAYRRDLHQRFGAFDESLAYYWDWDFYLKLANGGMSFHTVPKPSVWVSARESSVSSNSNADARRAELDRLECIHHLGKIVLKNHALIAEEQAQAGAGMHTGVDLSGARA